ncbi:DUF4168 domain-containing protein [Stutzerimonas tarimensis]|uniref:DUF4168 domain-containing protein n=1 Tax=Stutzerimonas tarimensis TaxID=1507735 RepID=A0ABV7T3D7_9GAMM
MIKHNARLAFAGLFAAVLALGAPLAQAQAQAQAPATQGAPATGAAPMAQNFSDEQLERYAESLGEIVEIREDFTARLEDTSDVEEARELQQQAQQEMMTAVEDNGMSVEEYNAISQALQTDPDLRDRVIAMLD